MKKLLFILLVCVLLLDCLVGCAEKPLPKEMPEDFSFALTWGVYGISSYDSRTGKLVKTKDATNPRDYVTYVNLSDEVMELVYKKNLSPTFICESDGTQAEDAKQMKDYYLSL